MTDWVITKIEITGDRATLEEIADTINYFDDLPKENYLSVTNWVGHTLDRLHINSKRYAERAFWYDAYIDKNGHLIFMEKSCVIRSRCVAALKMKFQSAISGINYTFIMDC